MSIRQLENKLKNIINDMTYGLSLSYQGEWVFFEPKIEQDFCYCYCEGPCDTDHSHLSAEIKFRGKTIAELIENYEKANPPKKTVKCKKSKSRKTR